MIIHSKGRTLSRETYLIIRELETELLDTALDSIPTSETVSDRDIAR